jgi:hypothetical protein
MALRKAVYAILAMLLRQGCQTLQAPLVINDGLKRSHGAVQPNLLRAIS